MLSRALHSIQWSPTWPIIQKENILTSGARKRGKERTFLFSGSMKSQGQFIIWLSFDSLQFCIVWDLKERISLNLVSFMPWLAASFTLQRHTSRLTIRYVWFFWDCIQFSYAPFCKWPKVSMPCDPRTFSVWLPLVLGLSWGKRAFSLAAAFDYWTLCRLNSDS